MKKALANNTMDGRNISLQMRFHTAVDQQQAYSPPLALYLSQLTAQTDKLRKIGHIMSHEVRQPLACIMGLINAIKEDNYTFDKEMVHMLELEANELDARIKAIVNLAE